MTATGITIERSEFGGFVVSFNGAKLGTTGSFGTEAELLTKARTFADGAAAAVFQTTGAVVSIEEVGD